MRVSVRAQPVDDTRNRYRMPVPRRAITSILYDASPYHKDKMKHAVDFIVPEGTEVLAALNGIVSEVMRGDPEGQGENWLEISHAREESSEYGHLKEILVAVGTPVFQGQAVAKSGSSGDTAGLGPHLHFEVDQAAPSPEDWRSRRIRWEGGAQWWAEEP